MLIPDQGRYKAKINGQIVIYITPSTGSLAAAIPVALVDSNPAWEGKFVATLILADETVQKKTIDNLKKCFGWDGVDPFWLMAENPNDAQDKWKPRDLSMFELEAVGGPNEYQDSEGATKVNFKIQWLNPAGSSGAAMPEAADRKAIMAKFGSRLRALNGTSVAPTGKAKTAGAKKTEPAKTAAAAKTPPGKAKPAAVQQELDSEAEAEEAPESTCEDAWAALTEKRSDLGEAELGEMWYAEIEKRWPGKNNDDLDAKQFGALKQHYDAL